MSTSTFGRLLGSLFGVKARQPNVQPTQANIGPGTVPIVVGQGARNERHIIIAGEPMLFRDEGGVVVQFRPAFDFALTPTSSGVKLIPALSPHWEVLREHRGTLTDAIAAALRATQPHDAPASQWESCSPATSPRAESLPRSIRQAAETIVDAAVSPASPSETPRRVERARYGILKEWGEKQFPDGKRPGKTYESFCITLAHHGGQDVLQGEGLRDAIADAGCKVGDRVEVRRLGKTKVPAVDKRGRPKLDASGAQVLWDKWLWSIKKS